MTTLYGWGPMFDTPSPSPYVMKTDMQLQMLGVDFDRAIADLDSVSKRKAPYVEDEGEIIQDSNFIRAHFEKKLGTPLYAGMSQKDVAASWALERMAEEHLVSVMAGERWLVDANFEKGPALFFADVPVAMRDQLINEVRGNLRENRIASGIGRHSREEQMQLAEWDIMAIAAQLGDQAYLFGDEPTCADAAVSAVLIGCATPFFDTPLVEMIRSRPDLVAYMDRIEERYFQTNTWPALMAA